MAARMGKENIGMTNNIELAREEANRVTRAASEISRTADQVAERVEEFENAGVDLLLLQCSPQLEEMERFAETIIRARVPVMS